MITHSNNLAHALTLIFVLGVSFHYTVFSHEEKKAEYYISTNTKLKSSLLNNEMKNVKSGSKCSILDTVFQSSKYGIFKYKLIKILIGNDTLFCPDIFISPIKIHSGISVTNFVELNINKVKTWDNPKDENRIENYKFFDQRIEKIYYVVKTLYESNEMQFPLQIQKNKETYRFDNSILYVEGLQRKFEIYTLKMKWEFSGGDTKMVFKKVNRDIQVTVEYSPDF